MKITIVEENYEKVKNHIRNPIKKKEGLCKINFKQKKIKKSKEL